MMVPVRSYGQYCPLAKALDVIGDRWSLLIVRELLLQGPCRYTDIRRGLPGVATNLLAERLRELEHEGIIWREAAPPPVATTLFHLTDRGKELRGVLRAIGLWGLPLLKDASDDDLFHSYWLGSPISLLTDSRPELGPVTIAVHTGDAPVTIEVAGGMVRTKPGAGQDPDAVMRGAPPVIVGVLLGEFTLEQAMAEGMDFEGDPGVLARVQPKAAAVPDPA